MRAIGSSSVGLIAGTSGSSVGAFSFVNQTGDAQSSTATSNTIVLTGGFSGLTVTAGTNCTGISVNGASFVSGPVAGVNSGDTLAIQQDTSASPLTSTYAAVTVGSRSSTWFCTTGSGLGSSTGGAIAVSGGYRIHDFTTNGTFTAAGAGTVEYLIVGGGGGGGDGGGGGGQVLTGTLSVSAGSYAITVGDGGTGWTVTPLAPPGDGGLSAIVGHVTALGGGRGAVFLNSSHNYSADTGGSGGGGGLSYVGGVTTGASGNGTGTNAGGNGVSEGGGGGGGAGGTGTNGGPDYRQAGNGGSGISSSITGTSISYSGGGGGTSAVNGYSGSPGGTSGPNTGQGGQNAAGQSGRVVIRYIYP